MDKHMVGEQCFDFFCFSIISFNLAETLCILKPLCDAGHTISEVLNQILK